MAYTAVTLPLTGAGDATAAPAVDLIGGAAYQAVKLVDGAEGSTEPIPAKGTTPGSTDHGLVVRPIGSTAHLQGVSGAVALTSEGSTKVVGQVTVANPTTGVSVVGAVDLTSAGSTRLAGRVTVDNPTTSVDLGSGGSTKVIGTVNATGTTTVNVANPTTAVTVSSGVILGASTATIGLISSGSQTIGTVDISSAGSTRVIGTVNNTSGQILGGSTAAIGQITSGQQTIGTVDLSSVGSTRLVGTVSVSSGVILGAGSSANMLGTVVLSSGTTAMTIGNVAQGPGSSANYWVVEGVPFSSGNIAQTTINSSADVALLAANANRKAAVISNLSTGTELLVSFTTAVVSSAGPATFKVPANGYVTIGGQLGNVPLYRGPIRGKMNSTLVAGPLTITEFS